MHRKSHLAIALLACLAAASRVEAYTSPASLPAGSPYYLAFVTNGTIDATSTGSSAYTSFVQTQAAESALTSGATWQAMVNVTSSGIGLASGVPVFLVNGTELTANAGTLFTNSSSPVLNDLNLDQFGNTDNTDVWTGSNPYGLILWPPPNQQEPSVATVPMGTTENLLDNTATGIFLGSPNIGQSNSLGAGWLTLNAENGYLATSGYNFPNDNGSQLIAAVLGQTLPVYGISNELIAVGTPEPASATLLGLAIALLGGFRWLKRAGRAA